MRRIADHQRKQGNDAKSAYFISAVADERRVSLCTADSRMFIIVPAGSSRTEKCEGRHDNLML